MKKCDKLDVICVSATVSHIFLVFKWETEKLYIENLPCP